MTGTGAISATVTWYGKNRANDPAEEIATSSLSGTDATQTFGEIVVEWPIMYCVLTLISGTNAAVTATVSV
jgi:hypothetical protein